MERKTALITGANSGMGKATVKAFLQQNMEVIMLCRSKTRGEAAYNEITEIYGDQHLHLMFCDLGNLADICRFFAEFNAKYTSLNILVNNAGVISLDRRETTDGLEQQFGVNHIGHFLLTNLLLPKLPPHSRIVVVGSGAHKIGRIDFDNLDLKKGFSVFAAYGRSKLCNLLFARELAERVKSREILVNCVHPGAVATDMGVDRNTGFGRTVTKLLRPFFQTPEEGASTAVYVATSEECAGITGEYFYRKKIAKSSKRSRDKQLAAKLWEVSESLVKEYI